MPTRDRCSPEPSPNKFLPGTLTGELLTLRVDVNLKIASSSSQGLRHSNWNNTITRPSLNFVEDHPCQTHDNHGSRHPYCGITVAPQRPINRRWRNKDMRSFRRSPDLGVELLVMKVLSGCARPKVNWQYQVNGKSAEFQKYDPFREQAYRSR